MANVHPHDLCTYAFSFVSLMYVPVSSLYDCVFDLSVVTFSVPAGLSFVERLSSFRVSFIGVPSLLPVSFCTRVCLFPVGCGGTEEVGVVTRLSSSS